MHLRVSIGEASRRWRRDGSLSLRALRRCGSLSETPRETTRTATPSPRPKVKAPISAPQGRHGHEGHVLHERDDDRVAHGEGVWGKNTRLLQNKQHLEEGEDHHHERHPEIQLPPRRPEEELLVGPEPRHAQQRPRKREHAVAKIREVQPQKQEIVPGRVGDETEVVEKQKHERDPDAVVPQEFLSFRPECPYISCYSRVSYG